MSSLTPLHFVRHHLEDYSGYVPQNGRPAYGASAYITDDDNFYIIKEHSLWRATPRTGHALELLSQSGLLDARFTTRRATLEALITVCDNVGQPASGR